MTDQHAHEVDLTDGSAEALALRVCRPAVGDRVTLTYPADRFGPNMSGIRVGTVHALVHKDEEFVGIDVITYPVGHTIRVVFDEYIAGGAGLRPWKVCDGWKAERERKAKVSLVKKRIERAKLLAKAAPPTGDL